MNDKNATNQTLDSLTLWQGILDHSMQQVKIDLSLRQMAIMLAVYLSDRPQSVKTLAQDLAISKPAICRALDMLCRHGLLRRKRDEQDKRLMTLQRTVKGTVHLSEMAEIIRSEMQQHHQNTSKAA